MKIMGLITGTNDLAKRRAVGGLAKQTACSNQLINDELIIAE
jgi:hypothetical protein